MKEYSEEEITGMCEAYEFYSILPEELQAKIPNDFVREIKEYSKYKKGAIINCIGDIKPGRLSRSGVKKIAYMCLFFK